MKILSDWLVVCVFVHRLELDHLGENYKLNRPLDEENFEEQPGGQLEESKKYAEIRN